MVGRRHAPEQVVRKLREADRLLAEGGGIADAARRLEVSEQTCRRWRYQYGGMKAVDVKRLKALEAENARLERIVADKELELDALGEISRGKWWARRSGAEQLSCCESSLAFRSGGLVRSSASTDPPSATSRPSFGASPSPTPVGGTGEAMRCFSAKAGR